MRTIVIVVSIVAVVAVGALLAVRRQPRGQEGGVPLLATPAWQGAAAKYGEQLLLRREAQAGGVLLLKHSGHGGAYRYDGSTRTLAPVTEQEWIRAAGPIAECGRQGPPSSQVLRIDQPSHRLLAGSREIPAAGPVVLALTESPSHRFVAVLSASGPAQPSLVPFLGAGGAAGQHFHQVVSLPDAAVAGSAIRVPVQRSEDVLTACWAADEKAIVYHDLLFVHVSVIEL
jgi:hypothetical protein